MALISFDLDGVLQRNPFQSSRPDGVFGRIKTALAPYLELADMKEAEAQILKRLFDLHKARLGRGEFVAAYDWDDIVMQVATALGHPDRFDVAAMVSEGCAVESLVSAYAGAADCLVALRASGHTLVSITNGFRSYQEPVLRKIGLLDYFTAVITPEVAGAAKPQAAIFEAANRYGSPRIHVGDTLLQDVAGAKGAGYLAIYIVQAGAPGFTELPPEVAALSAWARVEPGLGWLAGRLGRDKVWDGTPATELGACTPDAIVTRLDEIPATVAYLLGQ
jgi:putative hydrolase of the HAD superfamily